MESEGGVAYVQYTVLHMLVVFAAGLSGWGGGGFNRLWSDHSFFLPFPFPPPLPTPLCCRERSMQCSMRHVCMDAPVVWFLFDLFAMTILFLERHTV